MVPGTKPHGMISSISLLNVAKIGQRVSLSASRWQYVRNPRLVRGPSCPKRNLISIACNHKVFFEGNHILTYLVIPKELDDKYADADAVKDLMSRKTATGLFEENPDFPGSEDPCWFLLIEAADIGFTPIPPYYMHNMVTSFWAYGL